jgi:hypothetical protein
MERMLRKIPEWDKRTAEEIFPDGQCSNAKYENFAASLLGGEKIRISWDDFGINYVEVRFWPGNDYAIVDVKKRADDPEYFEFFKKGKYQPEQIVNLCVQYLKVIEGLL